MDPRFPAGIPTAAEALDGGCRSAAVPSHEKSTAAPSMGECVLAAAGAAAAATRRVRSPSDDMEAAETPTQPSSLVRVEA